MVTALVEASLQQEVDKGKTQRESMIVRATELAAAIKDEASCKEAAGYANELYRWVKFWKEKLTGPKEDASKAHKAICALEKELIGPAEQAVRDIIDPKVNAWREAEDRKRRAEAEKLAAEQRKREEDERLRRAAELEAAGEKDIANELLDAPIDTPHVELPKVAIHGQSIRHVYEAEVMSLDQLVKAVAAGKAHPNCVIANGAFLNQEARAQKELLKIPGVRVVKRSVTMRRGA